MDAFGLQANSCFCFAVRFLFVQLENQVYPLMFGLCASASASVSEWVSETRQAWVPIDVIIDLHCVRPFWAPGPTMLFESEKNIDSQSTRLLCSLGQARKLSFSTCKSWQWLSLKGGRMQVFIPFSPSIVFLWILASWEMMILLLVFLLVGSILALVRSSSSSLEWALDTDNLFARSMMVSKDSNVRGGHGGGFSLKLSTLQPRNKGLATRMHACWLGWIMLDSLRRGGGKMDSSNVRRSHWFEGACDGIHVFYDHDDDGGWLIVFPNVDFWNDHHHDGCKIINRHCGHLGWMQSWS